MKNRGEKQWLLIKHKDEFVSTEDILKDEHSVLSDRTLEDVAKRVEVKKK